MNHLRNAITSFPRFFTKTPHIVIKNTLEKMGLRFYTAAAENSGGICRRYVGSSGGRDSTIGALFEKWRREFDANLISEPVESVGHIMAHCLGTTQLIDVHKNRDMVLPEKKIEKINSLCSQRLKNMPIQYILGEWAFRHLTLKMSPPVFIPRPETEQLVDIVLKQITRKTHILDLCCGSGAIALSLLHENSLIKATAVDQSEAACHLTKHNAQKTGLNKRIRVIQSQLDHFQSQDKFDIIVSNPPYVFREDLEKLPPEIIQFEDLKALDGGEKGLDVIKTVLDIASEYLQEQGYLFMEVDPRHPGLIQDYLEGNSLGLMFITTYQDFSGRDRFVQIIKTQNKNTNIYLYILFHNECVSKIIIMSSLHYNVVFWKK